MAKILLVDDEPRIARVVRDMVENAMTFSDLISRYELGRSEGVVLRWRAEKANVDYALREGAVLLETERK